MKKIILFAVAFLCAAAPARAQQSGTQAVNADSVPIEEYVPKVIIEGKWGTGPGEFGGYDEPWKGIDYKPSSLVVDSHGDIYILDFVNERIQKYSSGGKYLKSIQIEGFSGQRKEEEVVFMVDKDNPDINVSPDHPRRVDVKRKKIVLKPDFKTIGINIVIDSKDTLYYYLKRVKNGKEAGEVWEFRTDKLVKRISFPQKESLPAKFELHLVAYDKWELGVVEEATPAKESHKYRIYIRKEKENSVIEVEDNSGKQVSKTVIKPSEAYQRVTTEHGRAKSDVYFEKMLDNGNFQVRVVNGGLESISTEEREYTPEGKLVRRIKSPPGDSYGIDVGENGVKVVRWTIQKSN